ncbi:MAG: hypothetical protein ABW069_09850, partial [Duganella sp.]
MSCTHTALAALAALAAIAALAPLVSAASPTESTGSAARVASGPMRHPSRLRALVLTALAVLTTAGPCGHALAVEVIYQGPPGTSGLTGTTPGAPGTAGSDAVAARFPIYSND